MASSRLPLATPVWAALVLLALWLAGCASPGSTDTRSLANQPELLGAIKTYYEHNAVEENNACKAPIMDGVTRSELVSQDGNQLVVQVTYKYSSYTTRRNVRRQCSSFASRTFTMTRGGGRFQVIGMTGEVRTGPSWRLW